MTGEGNGKTLKNTKAGDSKVLKNTEADPADHTINGAKSAPFEPSRFGRDSNFELLRILAILFIISFHCAWEGGFEYPAFCFNKFLVESFHMLGEIGVNLFILISGYHMIRGRFKIKKLISLLLQVQFYNWICVFLCVHFGTLTLDRRTVFINFFPVTEYKYWFATVYILLYLFSPYINRLLLCLSRKEFQKMLLLCLAVFCIFPTVYGALKNDTETLFYYNRFIWLLIVYMIGAYIRLYPPIKYVSSAKWLGISALIFFFMECAIYVMERFQPFFNKVGIVGGNYFWRPNTIPVAAVSLSLFLCFRFIKVKPIKAVNLLASTTFGIYLLHDGQLNFYMWQVLLKSTEYTFSPRLILFIPMCALLIFITGACVDFLRQLLFRLISRPVFRFAATLPSFPFHTSDST